jgi:hypothetical protein
MKTKIKIMSKNSRGSKMIQLKRIALFKLKAKAPRHYSPQDQNTAATTKAMQINTKTTMLKTTET